jgi:3-oxoadipate enol-lactonase
MQDASGKARAQDGCFLSCRLYPQAGKPRIVLIHSLALDRAIWNGVIRELSPDFEILAYDCRGHGQSERRPGTYTAQLFADDLAALLDHCGWPSATIVGCSMGGCVAQSFGAKFPERTHRLALIDTTAWYGSDAPEDWRKRSVKAAETGFAAMLPFQLTRWFSDGFRTSGSPEVRSVTEVFLANDMACYQASCAMLGGVDLRNNTLRMPVSVIVGEEDYATPLAMAQSLHEMIPGSTLTVIPGGRHLTPVQCPQEVSGLLKALIKRTNAVGGA